MTTKNSGATGIDRIETDAIGLPFSFRNKIINGDFRIAQRAASATITFGTFYPSLDRWACSVSGPTTNTFAQVPLARSEAESIGTDAVFFARYTCTATAETTGYANLAQRIEDVRPFSGKQVTVSFTARKLVSAGNMSVELAQHFGSGGSPSTEVNGTTNPELATKIALTTEWQRYSFTTTLPSIDGKVLGSNDDHKLTLHFWFDAGSVYDARTQSLGHQSGTFDIIDVQLEEGPQATPFERRPIGLELSLCQRYCQITGTVYCSGAYDNTTPTKVISFCFSPKMRSTPTVTATREYGSGATSGTLVVLEAGANFVRDVVNINAAGGWVRGTYTLDAEL